MEKSDDKTLILRCLTKDVCAWNRFVERFAPIILWAIKRGLKLKAYHYNQQDLEDIFQNTLALLWEKGKLAQIRDRNDISGWLVMVAANCAYNYFRNKKEILLEQESLLELAGSSDCKETTNYNQKGLESILEQSIRILTPREHIIFKLSYLYDKTHQEIGKILKIPQNSVSSIIKRTKEKIKNELKKLALENF